MADYSGSGGGGGGGVKGSTKAKSRRKVKTDKDILKKARSGKLTRSEAIDYVYDDLPF